MKPHQEGFTLPARTLRALNSTDELPAKLRACVHEFGSEIVGPIVAAGVTNPNAIRSIVHSCWMGARQPLQRNRVGRSHSPVLDNLDWLLLQAEAGISAAKLLRILKMHGMVIIPTEPSSVMVNASMDATNHMGVVTKSEKHRNRLRAGIKAATERLWPHLAD